MWLAWSGLVACGGRAAQNPDGSPRLSSADAPSSSQIGGSSPGRMGDSTAGAEAAGSADSTTGFETPTICPALPTASPGAAAVNAAWHTLEGIGQGGFLAVAVDDSGVYWFDASFALHALRAGEPENVLRRAKVGITIGGLIATPDRLVWSEVADGSPTSQLEAIPKAGGAERILTEYPQALVAPLGFDASSVYAAVGEGDAVDLLRVNEGAISQLDLPPANVPFGLRDGGMFLWDQADSVRRLDLGTYQVTHVGSVGGVPQAVTDRYAVSVVHDARHGGNPIDALQLLELESGCILALPDAGSGIAEPLVADGAHVYWISKPAPSDPNNGSSRELLRIAVDSGLIEHLRLQGPRAPLTKLVGADSKALYVQAGAQLLRIEKP